ncbi:major facilitator superfamily domain-containing protein [Dactylonectria estremocensis]|uniref:Major facilitator superfamily domain-containing protein n=1 Tax=Dactylonectria estremocensis TaxID=1079267 RepID=A0A9P9F0F2_9HYPO|nr:major facilitator superfamily domain-containing protein [Dactylonectria estremocensis]
MQNPTTITIREGPDVNITADSTETQGPMPIDRMPTKQDQPTTLPDQSVLADPEGMTRMLSGPAYSVFSKPTRRWITALVVVASFVSPMTANIYFPALNPISEDLGVSTSLINLTLTSYMIFQGLSPTIFGDLGDMAGRRPAYILAMLIYVCANVGLALQRNFVALLVLRCLQSAGSSGTLVLGFAVVADISSTAERGKYMGFVGAGINIGPALGPVIGGILSQYLGWPAIFWFCAIFSFLWLIPWVLAAPETCRNVVGNGSIAPPVWNRSLQDLFNRRHLEAQEGSAPKTQLRFPNPLKTLMIVFEKEMALILVTNSIIYLGFILVAATLGTLFKEIYGYDDLQVGLCYLPYGLGCCGAVLAQGYVLDWNYRRIAKKIGFSIDRRRGDDLSMFPIESARLQPVYPTLLLGIATLIGYGWALQAETSVAVPLVLVFLIGTLIPTSFSVLNTLIVDLHPTSPATATSANNLVRCLMGAAATAAIDKMIEGMGRGWCFTFLALLNLAMMPLLRLIDKHGLEWRAAKAKRDAFRGV